jgi:hypothetical protein
MKVTECGATIVAVCLRFPDFNLHNYASVAGKPDGFEIKMTETGLLFSFCFLTK